MTLLSKGIRGYHNNEGVPPRECAERVKERLRCAESPRQAQRLKPGPRGRLRCLVRSERGLGKSEARLARGEQNAQSDKVEGRG